METKGAFDYLTDKALVRKIVKTKNTELFGVLYDRYSKAVYNKCYSFSKSHSEAEDLTQDVFLMLFVKLGSFKGRSKFSTWLYSFTYNFCVNYVNRNKQRKISEASESLSEDDLSLKDEVGDLSIYEMRTGTLKKALGLIKAEEKRILLLKYQDGVTIKELTEILDLGESAVKMRLTRAKASLLKTYNKIA